MQQARIVIIIICLLQQRQDMQSPTQLYVKEAARILAQNNESPELKVRSFMTEGFKVFVLEFEEISSTMLLSENWDVNLLVDSAVFVFVARRQRSGRGQKSNTWHSPAGNIYFTFLTKHPIAVLPFLMSTVSVSIIETLQSTFTFNQPLKIKWVNDILLGNLKLAGILVKTDIYGSDLVLQVGIGINANDKFTEETACLRDGLNNQRLGLEQMDTIIDKVCIRILGYLSEMGKNEEELRESYQSRLAWLNEEVIIYDAEFKNILTKGIFLGVNRNQFAIIRQQDGATKEISDGRMRKQKF